MSNVNSLFGLDVMINPILPLRPSDGENAKRIVRHGMTDVLEWLGEPVGPKPDEADHGFIAYENNRPKYLMVSKDYYFALKRNLRPYSPEQSVVALVAPIARSLDLATYFSNLKTRGRWAIRYTDTEMEQF